MTWAELERAATARHLVLLGAFHPSAEDALPGVETLVLIGPREPGSWHDIQASEEWGSTDPVDTWSRRVIGTWAEALEAEAFYPFDGPPWHPFIAWAKKTGRFHTSPVGMLVHDEAGLFVSFRGAIGVRTRLKDPTERRNPCDSCQNRPCQSACPVDALKGDAYAVDLCKSHIQTSAGLDCRKTGCRARRACPVSQGWGRTASQSAYHMQRFLGN